MTTTRTKSEELVAKLIGHWEARDSDGVAGCFTEEGVWLNIPYPPITGRAAIRTAVHNFIAAATRVEFIVHHMGEIAPGVVVTERTDIFDTQEGRTIKIPVMGIFEIGDGGIISWRDYFDPAAMNATAS